MKRLTLISLCMLFVTGASWASSIKSYSPVLTGAPIDFEGWSEGTLISNQYAGVTFGQPDGGIPQIDNYPWLYGYGCSSGSAALTGSITGGAAYPTISGITLTFDDPVSAVQAFLSDSSPLGDYTIYAYDAGNTLLESFTVLASETLPPGYTGGSFPPPGTSPLPGIYVGFTRTAADIAWVQIGPSSTYGDSFAIDDVQFVPEPATMCLLGLGALSLVRRKKVA